MKKKTLKRKGKIISKIKIKKHYQYAILAFSVFIVCFLVLWSFAVINICGDSRCDSNECSFCKIDCTEDECFNGICDIGIGENCENTKDCSCGSGHLCSLSRSNTDNKGCYEVVCGDNYCDRPNEVESNCCLDCGCTSGYECINNKCEIVAPELEVSYTEGSIYPTIAYSNPYYAREKGYSHMRPLQINIKNPSPISVSNLVVKAKLKGYSTDWSSQTVGTVNSAETKNLDFYDMSFSENLLSITEKTPVTVSIEVTYNDQLGNSYEKTYSTQVNVFGRNFYTTETTPVWVTSKSDTIRQFAIESVGTAYTGSPYDVEKSAKYIFDQLGTYGVDYISDPKGWGDYMQFPAETLKMKAGDCDDLAVLYAALLESIGIKTQIVVVPGHMFMRYFDGLEWHSVETTMIGSDFTSAKFSGTTKFNNNLDDLKIIDVEETWIGDNLSPVEPELGSVPLPSISLSSDSYMESGYYGLKRYHCLFTFNNNGGASGSRCGNFYILSSPTTFLVTESGCLTIGAYSSETKTLSSDWTYYSYDITCEFIRV